MCFPKPPKPDPEIKRAQEAARAAEALKRKELKEDALRRSKMTLSGFGIRSLIGSTSGSGYGRNFTSSGG